MRVAQPIELSPEARERLESLVRSGKTPTRLVERARIVLLASRPMENKAIAEELGITQQKAGRWRSRYVRSGLAGIEKDAPRPGRKPKIAKKMVEAVVKKTQEKPPHRTHWSTRTMAAATGLSASTIRRIWKAHGLKPHLVRTFKISNDPLFVEKLEDVVGLYLSPPENAIVISADEKSQIQALDRSQPGLPLKKGRVATMTHDYKRNGTTTLFAALNVLTGAVIGSCMEKHTHKEWLRFLKLIDASMDETKDLHVIADNYGTHKHPKVKAWLARHPRFHMHFVPTSCSWLNMVERFFRDITENAIRRGVFRSVEQLELAIEDYLAGHNTAPKPFIWTAKASDILEKVKRAKEKLLNAQSV
jgi:transposase